ncbi:hypothetical protein Ae707Ps1_6241c [Pseudonocardia sp. Ae707_Ps1]|nr:hypothetical protein Ae707Ps1_6241c [Pseudonocardia sp. Ae707_Ps1]
MTERKREPAEPRGGPSTTKNTGRRNDDNTPAGQDHPQHPDQIPFPDAPTAPETPARRTRAASPQRSSPSRQGPLRSPRGGAGVASTTEARGCSGEALLGLRQRPGRDRSRRGSAWIESTPPYSTTTPSTRSSN